MYDPSSGTVQPQAVTVARMDDNDAVIQSGLKPGQQVVIAGVHVLNAGQKVTVFQSKYDVVRNPQAQDATNSVVTGGAAPAASK